MLVLPLLLAGTVWLWHRWRYRAGPAAGDAPPFNPRALLALSFLAVWSHPLLDWLNTYGVRLLMPFDSRWFYGDTLFIIDPWFWLLAAVGVVLARSESRRAISGWLLLAALASGLVLSSALVPAGAKLLWCAGVAVIILTRWLRPSWANGINLARAGLLGLGLHVGAAYALGRVAEASFADRFPQALQIQANPMPASPIAQRTIVVEEDRYRIFAADGSIHEVARRDPDAVVLAALASPEIRGFAHWMRFPTWQVVDGGDHWQVRFVDLRYQGPDIPETRSIGVAEVAVPKDSIRQRLNP